MDKIRVGVVGVGRLGGFHAQKYAANESADLLGVFDPDTKRAEEVAKQNNCRVYPDLDSLLKDVSAVSCASPTTYHHATGMQIIDSGVHLLMEKPIAATSAEAQEMVELAEKKNLKFQIGHIERFNPAVSALRGIDIDPKFVEAHRLAPYTPRGADVSVIHDLMIHDIDVLLHLMGIEVERVDASGIPIISNTVDIANVRINFSGKRVANLTSSRISMKRMRKFRIFQEDTYIAVNFEKRRAEIYKRVEKGTPKSLPIPGAEDSGLRMLIKKTRAKKNEDALAREVDAFLNAINSDTPAEVTGRDGLVALQVVEEIAKQCGVE